MSLYLSIATGIDRAAAENASALPDAPRVEESLHPARWRLVGATILRRLATMQVAAAARLESPGGRRFAAA